MTKPPEYKLYGQAPKKTSNLNYNQPLAAFIAKLMVIQIIRHITLLSCLRKLFLLRRSASFYFVAANGIFLDRNIPNMAYSNS
jgi:hypothetical protein